MASKSDLISIELPDASGKTVPFYTYDGFLEENDRTRIRSERRGFEQLKVTGGAIFGFVGYYATRCLTLPVLNLKGCKVPVAGLLSGAAAGLIGFELFSLYGSSRLTSIKRDLVLASQGVPLWSNLRSAVNPDRAFFELADERHNEPLIFHSGLSPATASKMIPDKIIGSIPAKPHSPQAHH